MKPFDVYSAWDVTPVSARGCTITDAQGREYLDFYGGHAVISIGHLHPQYVAALETQLRRIGFYSNAVTNPLQEKYAQLLGGLSGCGEYSLFLCNSGAEANENALKLASFHTGRKHVLAFRQAFHGRTSGAVAATDIPAYCAPFNHTGYVTFLPLNDAEAVASELASNRYAAVIIEGIQGVGGVQIPSAEFLRTLRGLCTRHGTMLVLDEIQSGCGRTGDYFAYRHAGIAPDLVTLAKGIGNGFPMGAVFVSPQIEAVKGRLGTTFGGNYLACAAGIAVAEVMRDERLMENATAVGEMLRQELAALPGLAVRGRGLMIGIEMERPVAGLRRRLLFDEGVFTGSSGTNIIRLLPPLCVTREEAEQFIEKFKRQL